MGKVYTTQDKFTIYVNVGSDLLDAGNVYLAGTDPSGSSISPELPCDIENSDEGIIRYEAGPSDFTTAGVWTLWAHIDYVGGAESWGEPFHLYIYSPGT